MLKRWRHLATAVCFLISSSGFDVSVGEDAPAMPQTAPGYAEKLAEYEAIHGRFEEEAQSYWQSVADKRRARISKRRSGEQPQLDDYVLTQPPVYRGPPKPADPAKPPGERERPSRAPLPVVADFLKNAKEQYGFVPDRPRHEDDFKKAYARTARQADLTREQIVRIYGFESGGNGGYDVQAGLEHPRPDAHAISTALGYNQLLTANSVELLEKRNARPADQRPCGLEHPDRA